MSVVFFPADTRDTVVLDTHPRQPCSALLLFFFPLPSACGCTAQKGIHSHTLKRASLLPPRLSPLHTRARHPRATFSDAPLTGRHPDNPNKPLCASSQGRQAHQHNKPISADDDTVGRTGGVFVTVQYATRSTRVTRRLPSCPLSRARARRLQRLTALDGSKDLFVRPGTAGLDGRLHRETTTPSFSQRASLRAEHAKHASRRGAGGLRYAPLKAPTSPQDVAPIYITAPVSRIIQLDIGPPSS